MDQGTLVENQIDDGFRLVKRLAAAGFDVAAAFWVRASQDGQWTLYIASKVFDKESGPAVAYRKVADALRQLNEPWVSMSDIKVIGEQNPITRAVLEILRRHPGPMATRSRGPVLGIMEIEEVYIYPPIEEAARRPPPKIRITGFQKVARDTAVEEVPEVAGYVEGFIGEPDFNTKFVTLIKSKFGSTEQFGVTYPRIVLEEV